MDYATARKAIQSGDLIAFRGRSWIGWLIKAITGGAWSHVAVAWWFRDRLFLLEAIDGRGVGIRAASVAAPFDHIKTEIEWTPIMEDRALALLGKPYSYRDFIRAGLGLHLGDPHGEICSEYAARI